MENGSRVPRKGSVILEVEVPQYTKDRIDEYAASRDFGSVDNFVNAALGYFIGLLHAQQEAKK